MVLLYLSGCSGCSRSGSHQPRRSKRTTADQRAERPAPAPADTLSVAAKPVLKQIGDGPTEVAMERDNGVYKVPVTVNGVSMRERA